VMMTRGERTFERERETQRGRTSERDSNTIRLQRCGGAGSQPHNLSIQQADTCSTYTSTEQSQRAKSTPPLELDWLREQTETVVRQRRRMITTRHCMRATGPRTEGASWERRQRRSRQQGLGRRGPMTWKRRQRRQYKRGVALGNDNDDDDDDYY
jgi:hypothetical protein